HALHGAAGYRRGELTAALADAAQGADDHTEPRRVDEVEVVDVAAEIGDLRWHQRTQGLSERGGRADVALALELEDASRPFALDVDAQCHRAAISRTTAGRIPP